jgi:hypothetical protein
MKAILTSVIIFFTASILIGQQVQFMTYTSILKIIAAKNGETFEWENKDIGVKIDYQSGEFITRLKNSDFVNTTNDSNPQKNTPETEREFTLEGTFPIAEIIQQQQAKQNYKVELHLINSDLDVSETILFDLVLTKPESGNNNSYRGFSLNGVLYNDRLNLPSFAGFDNEIELWLIFNGSMNTK